MQDFRELKEYKLARQFYRLCIEGALPSHLSRQMKDALSSVCLNIAEGYGKRQMAAYYKLAAGSLCEVMAAFDLEQDSFSPESFSSIDATFKELLKLLNGRLWERKVD